MNPTSHQLLTRRDYCQFLLSSQKNFTLTYFAEHSVKYSHDQLNRYLSFDNITPADIWAEAKHHVVTCVYVNPSTGHYWIIDYRFYDKDSDEKTKLHHVKEMFLDCISTKKLPFTTVLMDSWYAVKWLMLLIESWDKIYYCPIKANRNVNEISNIEMSKSGMDGVFTYVSFLKGILYNFIVYRSLPNVQIILSRLLHRFIP